MIAAGHRPRPSAPPFFTDGRRHPEHPLSSAVRAAAHDDEDAFDFGDACDELRARDEEAPTGVERMGEEPDDEPTEPFVLILDPDEDEGPPTDRDCSFKWILSEGVEP